MTNFSTTVKHWYLGEQDTVQYKIQSGSIEHHTFGEEMASF